LVATTLHPPRDGGLGGNASFCAPPLDWGRSAACRGSDAGLFHGTPSQHRQAQAVCRGCPVAEVCLWSAMVEEGSGLYRYGVWGGCTPPQRHEIAEAVGGTVGEYVRRLEAALERHRSAQDGRGASDAA